MQLNWRKIIFIIVCAEFLFIYWNGLGAMNFKRQQTTHHAPTLQPQSPLTKLQPSKQQGNIIESDLHMQDQKAS
ncbi:hypothetical protein A8709_29170 [Paenibacillus pectinilyticus]|uniref:Uncharacterized protein n=1 Tax=Paenibacillus pectinilyticus TaxID=512399 RepID=A0A1C0ZV01_9BACL|nr:hypothetical protein [Paenibacillus pectinilyticus]OCT11936.1 hypothetical protein A8709_29170 [Paenibacillus pectinilyticus]